MQVETRFYRDYTRSNSLTHLIIRDSNIRTFILCKPDFPIYWNEADRKLDGKLCTKCERLLKRITGK